MKCCVPGVQIAQTPLERVVQVERRAARGAKHARGEAQDEVTRRERTATPNPDSRGRPPRYSAVVPPSITSSLPVMYEDSSEAR